MAVDKICLEGMAFYGYHGVAAAEKQLGQRFVVDVDLVADLAPAGQTDALMKTVDYSSVYRLVKEVAEGPSCNLIEAVAEKTASALLMRFDIVEQVRVKVNKPQAPIAGSVLAYVAVEITRRRA